MKHIRDSYRNGRRWIKADACDLRKGLKESMCHEWAGDCDLEDGQLQSLCDEYCKKRSFCQGLGLKDRKHCLNQDLCKMVSVLDKDATFLKTAEKVAMGKFKEKQGKSNTSEDSLFALSWECDRFKKLVDINRV